VLLLNTILTVEEGQPLSHKDKGWEIFIDGIMKALNSHPKPLVIMLWGNEAKEYKRYFTDNKHLILEAAHPVMGSNGFFGCKHFNKAIVFLAKNRFEDAIWTFSTNPDLWNIEKEQGVWLSGEDLKELHSH